MSGGSNASYVLQFDDLLCRSPASSPRLQTKELVTDIYSHADLSLQALVDFQALQLKPVEYGLPADVEEALLRTKKKYSAPLEQSTCYRGRCSRSAACCCGQQFGRFAAGGP